ncbi:unnamed protein product [Tenebrio molitor]|nr:unnamed protein product [Tenebrio molitor]
MDFKTIILLLTFLPVVGNGEENQFIGHGQWIYIVTAIIIVYIVDRFL